MDTSSLPQVNFVIVKIDAEHAIVLAGTLEDH